MLPFEHSLKNLKYASFGVLSMLISAPPVAFHVSALAVPRASAAGVELLCVTFNFLARLEGPNFAVLSDDERQTAARFTRHKDAIRYAATRVALRYAIAERIGMAASEIQFQRDVAGRPSLARPKVEPCSLLDFNVSHSGQNALIALAASRQVGVDIEVCRTDLNWQTLAPVVFAPHDEAHVAALPAHLRVDAFYDAWTAKEALLKALGIGIGRGMTWFSVLGGKLNEPLVRTIDRRERGETTLANFDAVWCVAPYGYAACLAWSRAGVAKTYKTM